MDINPQKDFRLSVIIPAYSEKESLIHNVSQALKANDYYIFEVILIVSPNADKETLKTCVELAKREKKVSCYIQKKNPGLGYALREAFDLARGTHIQILYSDCESDPVSIADFIQTARETNADVVVGSRWLDKTAVHNYPPIRYFFSRAGQKFLRILYRNHTHLHDFTFGYNLLKTDVVRNIVWWGTRHEIAMEMVLKPLKLNYHIEEIPVAWRLRNEGKSTLQITRYLYYPLLALFILFVPERFLRSDRKTTKS